MGKLTAAQNVILNRVKRYPKGVKIDATEVRTARVLARQGLIEYDERTGIATWKTRWVRSDDGGTRA